MNDNTVNLQRSVVNALIGYVDDDWERIVMNYEMQMADEGRVLDYVFFYIKAKQGGDYEKVSFRSTSDEINDAFIALADTMAKDGGRWGSCDVFVDADGKYDFKFSYDPPERINGQFDSCDRFASYLDQYRTERAVKAAG